MKLTKIIATCAIAAMIAVSAPANAGNGIVDWDTPIQFESAHDKAVKLQTLNTIEAKKSGASMGVSGNGPVVLSTATGNQVTIEQNIICEAGAVCKDIKQSTGEINQDNSGNQSTDTNISGNNFN